MTEADRLALAARLQMLRHAPWRTRFAPAPTGHLHLGHAVNAVFVWSLARAFGGSVLVRIEDHDQTRSRPAFEHSILSDLLWLGLDADNVRCGFPMPLRQSTRLDEYASALSSLAALGLTFRCRCSRRDIHEATGSDEGRYPGTCRAANVRETETVATRLTIDEEIAAFDDLRHGEQVQHPAAQCGDLLLRDRFGQWTYQYTVVVDDLMQQIDVIIRGDDLLSSTGRQLLLAQHIGRVAPPLFLHHPLVTHTDGSKLSKSNRDTALHALRDAGWTSAAVLGHAAWLGGLQATSVPIDASALAALWRRDE